LTTIATHPSDLDPSQIAERVYTSRRRRARIGVPFVLGTMLSLLYLFPARMIIPNLTLLGRPAMIIALLLGCWWLITKLNPHLTMVGPQPMRWAVLALAVSIMLSYVAGVLRGLTTLEADGANLALIWTLEFAGVVLIAADGIANWARLDNVLRILVACGGFMALIGIVQSVFKYDITPHLMLPGTQLKGDLAGFENRGAGFYRVASTATHYIELSALMAIIMPYAIHYARFSPTRLQRQCFGFIAILILAVIPMTLSRTGVVATGAALLVMVPAWNWRLRYNLLIIGLAGLGGFMALRPGVLGTLRSLFTGANTDPSIQGRQDDYADVVHYFSQRPWFGRGSGTFIPVLYRVLDNQWLGSLVTTGLVGVAVLAGLHLTCMTLAATALRRSARDQDRHLCAALISSQAIAVIVAGTFDSMAFSTYAFTLALLMGLCGTVWRFTHPARTVRTSAIRSYDP
jgi:O-antigen ligase